MSVELIISAKGRHVVTILPGHTVGDAANLLAERRIGAVVVVGEDEKVAGILSERDVVRAIAEKGGGALSEPVARYMTGKIVTCTAQSSINDIMGLMTEGKFRHVPVVEEGRLNGIVSIGDIVKHRLAEVEAESQAMRDYIATA